MHYLNDIKWRFNMSTIQAKNNLFDNTWDILFVDEDPSTMRIFFGFADGDKKKIVFNNLSFGFDLLEDGEVVYSEEYPLPGFRYVETDQEYLEVSTIYTKPNKKYVIKFWSYENNEMSELDYELKTPIQKESYPSWTFDGEVWRPPIPYPDDGNSYIWNERDKSWDLYDPDGPVDQVNKESIENPVRVNQTNPALIEEQQLIYE
jgi:hypothetical protein